MMGMSVVAKCPLCGGKGKVKKELPLLANPRSPFTHADKAALVTCPRCNGSGVVGLA
jgi:DnaJ-class molecular chaperone